MSSVESLTRKRYSRASSEDSASVLNGFNNSIISPIFLRDEITLLRSLTNQLIKPLDESPMFLNSWVMLSSKLEIAPPVVAAIASIDPATPSKLPRLKIYSCIALSDFATSVVIPLKVNWTTSPCAEALIPNSFKRSNSPVCASKIASVNWSNDLPTELATSPICLICSIVGTNPRLANLTKESVNSLT